MATPSKQIAATPEQVWQVLADGWLYTGWVVGASHIRAVDATWPAPGTSLHHAVGGWPLMVRDHTDVVAAVEPSKLVLNARAWPFGQARVTLLIAAAGTGSLVTMDEEPTGGPGKWLHNPLQRKALEARNRECLARLAALVEGRAT